MKYICNEDFKINDVLVGKKGDVLEITDAIPEKNETLEQVEGYVNIKNLNTNTEFESTWIDIDDDILRSIEQSKNQFQGGINMKLLRFNFVGVNNGTDIDFFVSVDSKIWENTSITKNDIEDAIASYIENVEDWQMEELITDVLNSFGLDFEYVDVTTFSI